MTTLTGGSTTCVSLPPPCPYQTRRPSLDPPPMTWSTIRVLPNIICLALLLCPQPVDGQGMVQLENYLGQVSLINILDTDIKWYYLLRYVKQENLTIFHYMTLNVKFYFVLNLATDFEGKLHESSLYFEHKALIFYIFYDHFPLSIYSKTVIQGW